MEYQRLTRGSIGKREKRVLDRKVAIVIKENPRVFVKYNRKQKAQVQMQVQVQINMEVEEGQSFGELLAMIQHGHIEIPEVGFEESVDDKEKQQEPKTGGGEEGDDDDGSHYEFELDDYDHDNAFRHGNGAIEIFNSKYCPGSPVYELNSELDVNGKYRPSSPVYYREVGDVLIKE